MNMQHIRDSYQNPHNYLSLLSSLPGITCKPVSADKSTNLADRIAKALVTDIYESTQYDGFDINLKIMH